MVGHQLHHTIAQPQNSSPLVWPVLGGSFRYVSEHGREIAPIGNPVLWLGFLVLAPLLLIRSIKRDVAAVIAVGAYAAMYLPWLLFSRTQFVSYMTPVVPFMCLGVACGLRGVRPKLGRPTTALIVTGAIAGAVWLAPVWLGLAAPHAWITSVNRVFGV
jgi:dolichyl-phosphate-mannose--protein O-mannosyl transferase